MWERIKNGLSLKYKKEIHYSVAEKRLEKWCDKVYAGDFDKLTARLGYFKSAIN